MTKLNPTGSTLVYSTYLGGSGNDNGRGIAVDSSGNAYVAGNVNSTDFPTASPFQAALGGTSGNDAFVTKFNPAGSALIYSTYLGGSLNDVGIKIATDTSGNASVIGFTRSTDFPTANAFQASFAGTDDAFVTKLNPTGSALVFSTYLGGIGDEEGDNIAVDGSGNVYVSGSTTSTDFPTANPFQAANAGSDDAFVTKFSATGSAVYSTYLGGSGFECAAFGLAVDASGNAYATGCTLLTDFPTVDPIQASQARLAAGVYQGTITATFSSGPPQEVEVLLIVASQAGVLRTQAAGLPRAAQCAPLGLQLLATTVGNGLSLPVSFPRVLTALVVDDCGSAVDNATLVTSVEGLNIPLRSLGTGFYSGTWVPRSEAASVTLTFDALHPTFAQVQRSFTVSTAAAPGAVSLPTLFADGVVEGAGFTPLRPLSAGGIISLFGARFASGNHFPTKVPLERELGGVSVRIGGQDAPLFFVGPGQINAQMPFEVSPGDSVPVAVSVGGLLTAPQNYLIAPVQPGIFDLGGGQGAVSIANTLILVAPVGSIPGRQTRPAEGGEFVSIFCTGLGATSPTVGAGEPGAGETVTTPVTATIGGVPASVSFAGLAPGFVGLYQVNAVVPEGVVPGPAVAVVITQDGIASNTVTIAVQ